MRKEHLTLNEQEHRYLTTLTSSGELKARMFKRAMALLLLHQGQTMSEVSATIKYAYPSMITLKKRFLQTGLKCLEEHPRTGRPPFFDGLQRARITALACSDTPDGRAAWTLRLLADKAVELDLVESISYSKVREILKKTN